MNYQGQQQAKVSDQYIGKVTQMGAVLGETSKRTPEIPGEMDRLDKAVANLHAEVEALIERLAPVRCVSPVGCGTEGSATPVATPLGGNLREYRLRIDAAAMKLRAARDELEI